MGNQPASGAGGSMSSRRSSSGYHSHQQHGAGSGAGQSSYGGSKPPPGGAAPVGYMQTHSQQYPGAAMKKSSSDMSMTDLSSHYGADANEPAISQLDLATISAAEEDTVPTVFRWEHGGRNVYITGTFNGWSLALAPDQPTVADIEGRINNFIDVTDFKAYTGDKEFEKERAAADYHRCTKSDKSSNGEEETASSSGKKSSKGSDAEGEVYGHSMPDLDEYTKEPPPLPPHLRHIILNKPPQLQDTAALPVPQHVALNHLYCTAIKDNMMVLGITQRYKTKSCTTVYYSPC
ncbi:hypothetical protein HJC23_006810 [Cyclotella cryptica]|uniref:Association with the SNF1 complex (ASC) domain-containing protein n=1 Tax=Cyclotella cryptica TaxID=29204 RepID=A0ABD3PEN5_9STRA|eukprot:CCRYP_015160-RA/>CCRYP_015160-RA protein AED:0.21 eAED:0.21 QI:0/0/0/1/1/1/2/0/290